MSTDKVSTDKVLSKWNGLETFVEFAEQHARDFLGDFYDTQLQEDVSIVHLMFDESRPMRSEIIKRLIKPYIQHHMDPSKAFVTELMGIYNPVEKFSDSNFITDQKFRYIRGYLSYINMALNQRLGEMLKKPDSEQQTRNTKHARQ